MQKVEPGDTTVLTDAKIRAIRRPEKGQIEVRDKAVPGLRVRVGVTGSKAFVLRKSVAGRYRNITLGRYCDRFGLAEARKKARQLLSDIEFKADPAAALPATRRRSHVTPTVRSLWPDYKAAKSNLRTIGEIERVFDRHILPTFGDRAADKITRGEITRFIDDFARTTPVMARNILSYFSAFYSWPCRGSTTFPATRVAMPGDRLRPRRANACSTSGR